jgi:hypothetical protein
MNTSPSPVLRPQERPVRWLQWVYLALAMAGAVLPWMANLEFIRSTGPSFDPGLFMQMAAANPAAASLSRDLAIGATAVLIWIIQENRRLQMRGLPWVLLSCVTVAFACGAPLFLYLRERRLAELTVLGEHGQGGNENGASGQAQLP